MSFLLARIMGLLLLIVAGTLDGLFCGVNDGQQVRIVMQGLLNALTFATLGRLWPA
jgi:hypothetical protein